MDLPKRTLSELVARYEFEPGLRDVFVEGEFDKEVLERAIQGVAELESIIYAIDGVEVTAQELARHKLTTGNKNSVIALARELASQVPAHNCRCIVDRDLDHWFGDLEKTIGLVWTQFCSIELYFYSDGWLRDIVVTTAKSKMNDWAQFTASLEHVLVDLYAMRLAARSLNLALDWISFDRCMVLVDDRVELDSHEYAKRLLIASGHGREQKTFMAEMASWRGKIVGSPPLAIRGHDLSSLLAWAIGKLKGLKQFATVSSVERLMVLTSNRHPKLIDLVR